MSNQSDLAKSAAGFNGDPLSIDTANNRVGIGTSSPSESLTNRGNIFIETNSTSADSGNGLFWQSTTAGWNTSSAHAAIYGKRTDASNGYLRFDTRQSGTTQEAMRIDSSGNLLVGTTTTNTQTSSGGTNTGTWINSDGIINIGANSNPTAFFNRQSTDGDIVTFRKDGSTVGNIGTVGAGSELYIAGNTTGLQFSDTAADIRPCTSTGSSSDATTDLGDASARFQDIYATNGTIQTSDRNEKQDIEALSDAEQRVAVVAKGLLRKFRWKSSVEEKGDEARIHFGIIAQDLQAAFEAEGLDAGRYAMFIHSTWTDEETGEERSRMGVRYPELLAFIIAAI